MTHHWAICCGHPPKLTLFLSLSLCHVSCTWVLVFRVSAIVLEAMRVTRSPQTPGGLGLVEAGVGARWGWGWGGDVGFEGVREGSQAAVGHTHSDM